MKNTTIVSSILLFLCTIESSQQVINISYQAGKNYKHTQKLGLIKFTSEPQIAFWLEDSLRKFIRNIYVTKISAKSDWYGGHNVRRPEALPIWSHKMGIQYFAYISSFPLTHKCDIPILPCKTIPISGV